MRHALTLLLDWAYADPDLAVVTWRAQAGNWASRRVAWSVGFTFGPTVPGMMANKGRRHDAWIGWLGRDEPRTPTTDWLEPVALAGGGVRLRAWRPDDGPALVEAAHDPVLKAALPRAPLPLTPARVDGYLLRVGLGAATGDRVAWCVADAASDAALGNVAVFGFAGGSAEVGYWAHPAGRGRGAMTTALGLVTRHALDPAGLGVRRLDLLSAAGNGASRRLAERVGFRLVGVEHASSPTADGGWDDTARYELVRG
ncbi:MAG: N-acetyltransferase [Nocardioides sp.]|nr:N-acetyltransferase [Nocardioides sp.]